MALNVDKLEKTIKLLQQSNSLRIMRRADGTNMLTDVQVALLQDRLVGEIGEMVAPEIAKSEQKPEKPDEPEPAEEPEKPEKPAKKK